MLVGRALKKNTVTFLFDMIEPKIIFDDDNVLVIDKPAGLAVHGDGADPTGTLVEWFLARTPEAAGVGEPRVGQSGEVLERSGVVHRLDKETSGVMILTKNQLAFDHLKTQFLEREVKKEYLAIVYGHLKEEWGTIDRAIGRSAGDWRRRSAERGAKGHLREAVTNWELVKQGEYEGEKFAYLKLSPQTGRMHQLRVHLKAIGHPIVGDTLYAGKKLEQSHNLDLKRLALHSHLLELELLSGDKQKFQADLPADLVEAIDKTT